MSEPPASRPPTHHSHRTLLERLTAFIFREPENREELLAALQEAHSRNLLDADALSMIEGVLQVSELRARDLMVPRTQMDVVDINQPVESWIGRVIETAHSRFPAYEGNRDHVIGILLAKDLLRYFGADEARGVPISKVLRPAVMIPESKRLNALLKEFRDSHNHMAVVVDEYGGVSGLLTIEDVLEEIVGDIDDEHDQEEAEFIRPDGDRNGKPSFAVRALTRIEDFNDYFGCELDDEEYDTVGGLVMHELGRLPRRGEKVQFGGFEFAVIKADKRRIDSLQVQRLDT